MLSTSSWWKAGVEGHNTYRPTKWSSKIPTAECILTVQDPPVAARTMLYAVCRILIPFRGKLWISPVYGRKRPTIKQVSQPEFPILVLQQTHWVHSKELKGVWIFEHFLLSTGFSENLEYPRRFQYKLSNVNYLKVYYFMKKISPSILLRQMCPFPVLGSHIWR